MKLPHRLAAGWRRFGNLTTFEQVIAANSIIILVNTLAAFLVTHASLEIYHFLIDTLFVLLATLAAIAMNALFLRQAFRPLFAILTTIRAIEAGDTTRRAPVSSGAPDAATIALAFNAMLNRLEAQQHARLREIAQAQEDERRRLALELHDDTGQTLTALMLRLEALREDLESQPDPPATLIAQIETPMHLAQRALTSVQDFSRQLRPAVLDDLGLAAALRWLADEMGRGAGLAITAQIDAPPRLSLPPLVETVLFRIAQEAVANAARHSGGQHVALRLTLAGPTLTLQIADDGRGFAADQTRQSVGLAGMRERIQMIGGRLTIRAEPGRGTTIAAEVPLGGSENADTGARVAG